MKKRAFHAWRASFFIFWGLLSTKPRRSNKDQYLTNNNFFQMSGAFFFHFWLRHSKSFISFEWHSCILIILRIKPHMKKRSFHAWRASFFIFWGLLPTQPCQFIHFFIIMWYDVTSYHQIGTSIWKITLFRRQKHHFSFLLVR